MIFFLDRDGTINVDYNFVHKREEWTFCDGAIEAIRLLNNHGYQVVVVTNQTGIIRRHFTLAQVEALHRWVDAELARHGAWIDAWYIAPWRPNMHEGRHPVLLHDRKPETGMFERAMVRFIQKNADDNHIHLKPTTSADGKDYGKTGVPDASLEESANDDANHVETAGSEAYIPVPFHAGVLETVRLTDDGTPQIVPAAQGAEPVDLLHRQEIGAQIATMYTHVFERSAMAGDKQSDLEPAVKLGMKPYLVKSVHYNTVDMEWIKAHDIPVFARLLDAVRAHLNT
ncbi:MAG: HAD-IIIA family hydrolase [Balneolales bacterium]|nr:HAD-IIIA family hydrolase [Balneolales bacterium]